MKLPHYTSTGAKVYDACLKAFDSYILPEFSNSQQNWCIEGMPDVSDFPEAGIEDGFMILRNDEILLCFEPVSRGMLELMKRQFLNIAGRGASLSVSLWGNGSGMGNLMLLL
jgi:hypothetical protein